MANSTVATCFSNGTSPVSLLFKTFFNFLAFVNLFSALFLTSAAFVTATGAVPAMKPEATAIGDPQDGR